MLMSGINEDSERAINEIAVTVICVQYLPWEGV